MDQACRLTLGTGHEQAACRQVLGRAFAHDTMRAACVSFAGSTLKASVVKGLPASFAVPAEIKRIAAMFLDLQQKRHTADYDLTERFARSDLLTMIRETEDAIGRFKALPTANEKKFFLACLWAWKMLANR